MRDCAGFRYLGDVLKNTMCDPEINKPTAKRHCGKITYRYEIIINFVRNERGIMVMQGLLSSDAYLIITKCHEGLKFCFQKLSKKLKTKADEANMAKC